MRTSDLPAILAGLIGTGIGASLTPAMHEREAAEQGLREIYRLIDLSALGLGVADLADLLTSAERMGFAGVNITHPCKQAVIPLLDEVAPEAAALGAVNTVVFAGGKRFGHNTDWWGWSEAFRRHLGDVKRDRAVQMGAGGAGSAVAHAALTLGVRHLTLFDIDAAQAAAAVARLAGQFGAERVSLGIDLATALAEADGLINTTPVGMAKYPGMPVPAGLLHAGLWVSEIIYFPLETELLRTARALGCRTLDGGGMAVFQAVEAFRLFTGRTPDAGRMLAHFASLVSR